MPANVRCIKKQPQGCCLNHEHDTPGGTCTSAPQVAAGCFIRAVNSWLPDGSQLLGLRMLVASVLIMSAAMFAAKAFIDARILVWQRPTAVVRTPMVFLCMS